MSGWSAQYQGFNLRTIAFRRSPGDVADSFQATAIIAAPPVDVDAEPAQKEAEPAKPAPAALTYPGLSAEGFGQPNLELALSDFIAPPAPQPASFARTGDLEFREALGGELFTPPPIKDIVMVGIEKQSADRDEGEIILTLTDSRVWWERGFLELWRFNVAAVDGGFLADTGNPATGSAWTLAEIAEYVFSRIGKGHRLTRVPTRWVNNFRPGFTFARFSQAKRALAEIIERFPARVVLHLDNTVGVYESGEGGSRDADVNATGKAVPFNYGDGSGENATPIPLKHLRPGPDNTLGRELGLPPDEVLVVGGERWATISVDWWEPVLRIKGDLYSLSEGFALLVRGQKLLRAQEALEDIKRKARVNLVPQDVAIRAAAKLKKSIDDFFGGPDGRASKAELLWLQRWVLRPDAFQVFGGKQDRLDLAMAFEVLSRDAYRLWRCPFSETNMLHTSPMANRAEASGGVRAPILIETYKWKEKVIPVAGVPGSLTTGADLVSDGKLQEYNRAKAKVKAIGGEIDLRMAYERSKDALTFTPLVDLVDELTAKPPGVEGSNVTILAQKRFPGLRPRNVPNSVLLVVHDEQGAFGAGLRTVVTEIGTNPQLLADLKGLVGSDAKGFATTFAARGLALYLPGLIAEKAGLTDLAASYTAALLEQAKAAQPLKATLLNTSDLELQLAVGLVALGREVKKRLVKKASKETGAAVAILDQILERFRTYERASRSRFNTGLLKGAIEFTQEANYPTARYFVNLPRTPDADARVEDSNQHLIRTREPAGHLERVDVDTVTETRLVPRPIRVTWGVRVAPPRRDGRPVAPIVFRNARALTGSLDDKPSDPVTNQDLDPEYARPYVTSVGLGINDAERHGNLAPDPWIDLQTTLAKRRQDYKVGYYWSGWRRTGPGSVTGPLRATLPAEDALQVDDPGLVELIGVFGETNQSTLDQSARQQARAQTRRKDVLDTGQRVYRRPWAVDCDGLVAGVEIFSADDLSGLRTRIVVGDDLIPFADDLKTFIRPKGKPQPQPHKRPDEA